MGMGSRDIKGGKPFSSTGVGKARGKNKRTDWGAQQWKEGWEEGKGKEMAGAAGQGMKAAPVTCKMKLHTAAAPGAHLGQGALCLCFSNKWGLVALLASPTWNYILFWCLQLPAGFLPCAETLLSPFPFAHRKDLSTLPFLSSKTDAGDGHTVLRATHCSLFCWMLEGKTSTRNLLTAS